MSVQSPIHRQSQIVPIERENERTHREKLVAGRLGQKFADGLPDEQTEEDGRRVQQSEQVGDQRLLHLLPNHSIAVLSCFTLLTRIP